MQRLCLKPHKYYVFYLIHPLDLSYSVDSQSETAFLKKNISFHCHKPGPNTIFLKDPFQRSIQPKTHKASGLMITNYYHTTNEHCQVTGYPKLGFSSFSLTSPSILLDRIVWGLGLSRRRMNIILFWRVMPWIMQIFLPWRLRQNVPPETCQISTGLRHVFTEGKLPSKFQYLPTFTPVQQ